MTMKLWLILFVSFLFLQSMAKAESIYTTVFNVFPSATTERLLILSGADGRVYKTFKSTENLELMKSLVGQVVKIDYSLNGEEANITNIQVARANEVDAKTMDLNHFQYNELRQFAPTDLQSVENATAVYKNMMNDGEKSRSQCFKRAHMWAYDMFSKLGIKSEKIFIFYTRRYQELEDFKWWFHVAPVVTVKGERFVMDGVFMEGPVTIKHWKDFFIKSERITCPMIDNYMTFDSGSQWSKLCYLMVVPMYHFRPYDLQARDQKGVKRNHWVFEELQDARKAFKNWDESYEGLDNGKFFNPKY
jgi:hypothetical protein